MNPAGSEPFGEAGAGAGFGGGAVVVGAGFGAGGGVVTGFASSSTC
ncbi:hypothetical protein QVH35_06895 [Candidatus Nitrosotenuis chungbukensis]|nr:hypothetical protein [Candidatus Nitrosotenuis chungbukensis]WKT57164.1 hypothetical protein QVH35_06895 [Candidatus Nitrosotenuis chungbukensis]